MPQDFSVLIVEDDDDASANMIDILALDGYQVQSARNCLEAINTVEQFPFDAVIVDWKLPDQNADHLIPIILEHLPDTPIIVITGYRDFDAAVLALRKGAYDFLIKPINPEALRSVLYRVNERREHLRKIDDAQQKILVNERLAAIGQMVAGLAHESRNAFQRSHACLATLALDLDDRPESLELVQKVQKALDDLHFLLEEVRVYSAPINLKRQNVELASLAEETWDQIQVVLANDKKPKFEIVIDEGFPESCFIDRLRIQQVLRNLLDNARFAIDPSGSIRIRLQFAGEAFYPIRISVEDDGKGIDAEARASVFEPFFTTKTKGTGLGLAISKRIVEAHQGKLSLKNSSLGGANFVIELSNASLARKR